MSNLAGVGCSKGCNNPVVGQCQGYNGQCGAFYCVTHSSQKLCVDCAGQRDHDAYVEETIREYTVTAQALRPRLGCGFGIMFFILFGGIPLGYLSSLDATEFMLPVAIFVLVLAIAAIIMLNQKHRIALTEAASTRPHFETFYEEWRKEQNAQSNQKLLRIALATGSMVDSLANDRTRREVYKAAKKINRS